MRKEITHPIRYVAVRTGLTPHVIRAWEKRYGAVRPLRTSTNRRMYSESDIEKLKLLRKASETGHSISQIANLGTEELLELVSKDGLETGNAAATAHVILENSTALSLFQECLSAVMNLDAQSLNLALNRAEIKLTRLSLLQQVIVPLIERIGELWSEGTLKILNEHMASSIIRSFLGDMLRSAEVLPNAPKIIVTTPTGQAHELGAMILGAVATEAGWEVVYLGPNLPAEEIAAAAEKTEAKTVALSLVYPSDDPRLTHELNKLGRYLPDGVLLCVGGRAADAYHETLNAIGAAHIRDITGFLSKLAALRYRNSEESQTVRS